MGQPETALVAVVLERLKCHSQEDSEPPIIDTEDDEPYVLVFTLDCQGSSFDPGLPGRLPRSKVTLVGPLDDVDEGDLEPAPANLLWGLEGPLPMADPDRVVFFVQLMENDGSDPIRVRERMVGSMQAGVAGLYASAVARSDLGSEQARYDEFLRLVTNAWNGAIDLARANVDFPSAVDADDKIGLVAQLRFSRGEHADVVRGAVPVIERTMTHEGDDAKYDLTFSLRLAAQWHPPFPIAPPGSATAGAITAISPFPEHLDVFWIGPDGGIGTNFWDGQWHNPFPIAPPRAAVPGAIAAISRFREHLDVFWIGPDGGIGTNFWDGQWHTPFPIAPPGAAVPGAIAAVSRFRDHLDVFWIGPDGGIGTNFWDGQWHTPFPIAPPRAAVPGAIAAISRFPEHLDVFWIGPDGGIGTTWWGR